MKTPLALIALCVAAASPAMGAASSPDEPSTGIHICWELGDFVDARVEGLNPAQCTCDGLRHISFGGMTLGGNPGGNGGVVPDCFLYTILNPGHYVAEPNGSSNLVATLEPVIVEIRGCDTTDCYWFFGSASCVIESTHQVGSRVSYRVVGACSRTPE